MTVIDSVLHLVVLRSWDFAGTSSCPLLSIYPQTPKLFSILTVFCIVPRGITIVIQRAKIGSSLTQLLDDILILSYDSKVKWCPSVAKISRFHIGSSICQSIHYSRFTVV